MKKVYIYLTFIVMAVLAVACSKNGSQVDPTKPETAKEDNIGFGSVGAKRAGEVTPDDNKKLQIQVYDYYMAEGAATDTEYIDELIQEATTAGAWAYVKEGKTHSYSWKKGAHKFLGWVAVDESGTEVSNLNYDDETKVLTISGENNAAIAAADYRYAEIENVDWPSEAMYEKDATGKITGVKSVSLNVKHLTSALKLKVKNSTNANQTVAITSATLKNVVTTGSAKVDYSGSAESVAYTAGATGNITLPAVTISGAMAPDAEVVSDMVYVWPQEVNPAPAEGETPATVATVEVAYTLNGAEKTTKMDIPAAKWVAGNCYTLDLQIVNKTLVLKFIVQPWDASEQAGEINTSTGSINMSNVTWMNTKVIINGKLENTVSNSAYSVYMYKDVEIPSYDNKGNINTPVQKYTEEVAETYPETVYDLYPETIYDKYTETVYDLDEDGNPKTYEEDVLDPDTGNIIHAAGDPIILHVADEVKVDADGNPIILHAAGEQKLDADGNPIILHNAGDPVLDENGNQIVHHIGDPKYDEFGHPLYEHGTVRDGYFPAQGYFTVNYPVAGLFKIELIPAYGQTEADLDARKYEIWIYDNSLNPSAFRKINAAGETITNDTVYFQVRAAAQQDDAQHKAQINIWFKPAQYDAETEKWVIPEDAEWISAYSEIRANYALVIPATS